MCARFARKANKNHAKGPDKQIAQNKAQAAATAAATATTAAATTKAATSTKRAKTLTDKWAVKKKRAAGEMGNKKCSRKGARRQRESSGRRMQGKR